MNLTNKSSEYTLMTTPQAVYEARISCKISYSIPFENSTLAHGGKKTSSVLQRGTPHTAQDSREHHIGFRSEIAYLENVNYVKLFIMPIFFNWISTHTKENWLYHTAGLKTSTMFSRVDNELKCYHLRYDSKEKFRDNS